VGQKVETPAVACSAATEEQWQAYYKERRALELIEAAYREQLRGAAVDGWHGREGFAWGDAPPGAGRWP